MVRSLICCALFLVLAVPASAQDTEYRSSAAYTTTSDLSDVRPFQAWVTDAVITEGVDIEPELRFQDFDFASRLVFGARAAVWVSERVEAGGRWGFSTFDPEAGDSETGLNDLDVYARYRFPVRGEVDLAGGMEFGLPVGKDSIGASTFDFRAFTAMRYDVDGNLTLLGNLGIESFEVGDDQELGVRFGGGAIVPVTEELALITELDVSTAIDVARLTGGVDYELPPGGHLRAAIALGLDDGAPDFELILGFAIPVY